jgi:hypothetical protein
MRQTWLNPRHVFPAPGWKCFQCSVFEDRTEETCQVTHGTEMQLLVALQDAAFEAPMVYPSSDLDGVLSNAAFGFLHGNEALDDEYKAMLEVKARKKNDTEGCLIWKP